MIMKRFSPALLLSAFWMSVVLLGGCGSSPSTTHSSGIPTYGEMRKTALDTVQAGRFDGGRMWTFEHAPKDYFKQTYNMDMTDAWLDDVRMSALRFANYCSASFVSADGLVMTNHHCARESVEEVSKEGENLVTNGFIAVTRADERKVPGLYVEQMTKILDVTKEVHEAMDKAKTDEEKVKARREAVSGIESRLAKETGQRCQVTSLYNGGKYSAYIYKRYEDVRLVFAPELQLGFFGGDDDNFTYPRYTYDCSFFRVYDEKGNPLKTDHYFRWSKDGAKEGEATFVVGNPGSTSRLSTSAQLEFNRDVQFPAIARLLNDRVDVLQAYAKLHPEKSEEMINQIFSISNSQKAYNGQLSGLRDDVLMQRRKDFDKKFRMAVESRPDLKAKYGQIWEEIAANRARVREVAKDIWGLRMGGLGIAEHFSKAFAIARLAYEMKRPDAERAKQYRDKGLELMTKTARKPVHPDADMELLTLVKQLSSMKETLGANDEVVMAILKGRTPQEAAKSLIATSVLADSAKIQELFSNLPTSIETSTDPFIVAARLAVPRYLKATEVQTEVGARDEINRTLLGRALYDVYGTTIPPDATFTLRLADGVVSSYPYNGTKAPAYTTYYGMYDRCFSFKGQKYWDLPERWLNRPADFDLSTPLNFVATNDIIGGNSGSPMINRNKEIIGLVFDGNIESLPGEFIFAEDTGNRTVTVHSRGIVAGLRHIYKLDRIAKELESGSLIP